MIRSALLLVWLFAVGTPVPAGGEKLYRISGKILQEDGNPFRGTVPVIFLQGALTPFTTRTLANAGGDFSFKNLRPGMYVIVGYVARAGEVRKTVEVSPAFRDEKGHIEVVLRFERKPPGEHAHLVTATELSVPDSAWEVFDKAQKRLERHDPDGAQALLKKAVEIAPQFVSAWNMLGTICYQTQKYDQAEKYFLEALEHEPDAYAPLVNLGGTLLSMGRVQESLPINRQAVQMRPDDALARIQLGRSYLGVGQLDAAEEQLRLAKSLDPSHFSLPQLTLAEIYARKEDPDGMARELEDFLKLHPDSKLAPEARKSLEKLRGRLKTAKP
jgi:tetratricopeptide (TPR) repeat protein